MEEDDFLMNNDEKGPGDAIPERGTHFPEAAALRIHQRLAHWPSPLDLSRDIAVEAAVGLAGGGKQSGWRRESEGARELAGENPF
jgi:hypothetical protein